MTLSTPHRSVRARTGHESTHHLDFLDYLLIAGIVIAPMTGWRYGKIGPGEFMLFTWAIAAFFDARHSRPASSPDSALSTRTHLLYWLSFLSIITLATILQTGSAQTGSASTSGDLSNLATWMFLGFVSISIALSLRTRSAHDIERILYLVASVTAIWYGSLYVYSKTVSDTLLGAPLWYGGIRFSGGGTNPHQVALLLVSATLIFTYRLLSHGESSVSPFQRAIAAGGVVVSLALMLETQSETAFFAALLSCILAILIAISSRLQTHTSIAFWSAIIAVLALLQPALRRSAIDFIESDPNGMGRIELWRTVTDALDQNPLIGLGPGPHANDGVNDFHSTFLDILAMSGILGLGLFIGYSALILWKTSRVPLLLPVLASLFLYGISGFAARRLPFWTILILVVLLAERSASIKKPAVVVKSRAPALHQSSDVDADNTHGARVGQ